MASGAGLLVTAIACSSGRSKSSFEAIVRAAYCIGAVNPLEPAHREMSARHILEVLGEGEIDGRTAQSAEHRYRLRRHLLRHDDPEAPRDLRQKAGEKRRSLAYRAFVEREIGEIDQSAGEHRADREVIGWPALLVGWRTAECKHFEAGQPGARVGEVFPFLARDRRDRA